MSKIFPIALREFSATVLTKGFLIGILVLPLMIVFLATVFPKLIKSAEKAPRIVGEVAVVDPTGEVTAPLREYLEPEAIARRRGDLVEKSQEAVPDAVRGLGGERAEETRQQALDVILGKVPDLGVVSLAVDVDLDAEKEPIRGFRVDGGDPGARLALVVVDRNAIRPEEDGGPYGSYDLYVSDKLDDRIEDQIRDGLREAIIGARVSARGLDRSDIEGLTRVPRRAAISVGEEGETKTGTAQRVAKLLVPAAFMVLLLMSVLISGQNLLTTTVEEKSSRVVELLLSAVSPMELMTGKIVGQLCVGLLVLVLYAGAGILALLFSSLFGLVAPSLFVYLMLFYLVAFFTIASFMAAIGSAVNEMREAQTLMTPIMLTLMLPYMLWMPISRDPNSVLAIVLSFVPPVNSFVMMLRLTSTTPPPGWQVWLSLLVGVGGAYAAVWFAAKVFRIGLLMYGKPPNFRTLVKWVRMA